jgi:hypothetical protein
MNSLETAAEQLKRDFVVPCGLVSVKELRDEDSEFLDQSFHSALFRSKSRDIVTGSYPYPSLIIPLGTNEQWFPMHMRPLLIPKNY